LLEKPLLLGSDRKSVKVRIRRATPSDVIRVVTLVEAMGGHDGAAADEGTQRQSLEALENPRVVAVVAEHDQGVVGFGEIQARSSVLNGVREGWLSALAVDPAWRSQGIGGRVLAALEAEAAKLGCKRVVLESS
jgi:ribosomal protein S18 acetylase RimI-like enzyme